MRGILYAGMCPLVAGESDIDQLGRVIAVFGSMERAWPGVVDLPDYGKISFEPCEGFPLNELLPEASPAAIKLLNRLLQLDPGESGIYSDPHCAACLQGKLALGSQWLAPFI